MCLQFAPAHSAVGAPRPLVGSARPSTRALSSARPSTLRIGAVAIAPMLQHNQAKKCKSGHFCVHLFVQKVLKCE